MGLVSKGTIGLRCWGGETSKTGIKRVDKGQIATVRLSL